MKADLLDQQAQAAHELSTFQTPMDLSEDRQGTIDIFRDLTLPDFFYRLAHICNVPQKIALHTDIIKDRGDSFLSDLFSGRMYTDVLGRVVNQAPVVNMKDIVALVTAFIFEQALMYGVYGVLLPASFILAIKRPALPALALIPAVICVLLNSRQGALDRALAMNAFAILTLLTAFLSAIVGLCLIQRPIKLRVWRVKHWGYLFYPAHLAALQAVRALL